MLCFRAITPLSIRPQGSEVSNLMLDVQMIIEYTQPRWVSDTVRPSLEAELSLEASASGLHATPPPPPPLLGLGS